MGYQESYVTTGDPENFDLLIQQIRAKGELRWKKEKYILAVRIITINRDIDNNFFSQKKDISPQNFPTGTKFIYIVGERQYQRSLELMFDSPLPPNTCIIPIEAMPSARIFDIDSGYASHKEFIYTGTKIQYP